MKKFLAAVGLSLALLFVLAPGVSSFEPRNVRHYPGTNTNMPMTRKVADTATVLWAAVDQFGYANWAADIHGALDSDSWDDQSLARVYNWYLWQDGLGQITIRQAGPGESPDLLHYALPTPVLEARCGTWATACTYLSSALPVPAYYRLADLILWPYTSRAHVIRHETNHSLSRACDQYQGGCPRASDGVWPGTVVCTGNQDTLMDCGGAARTAQFYDYITFKTAYPEWAIFLQPRECLGPYNVDHLRWDSCDGDRWVADNGWFFRISTGLWYNDRGEPEWCAFDPSYGGRYNCWGGYWEAQEIITIRKISHWREETGWVCVEGCHYP